MTIHNLSKILDITTNEWNDWKWQLKNRINTVKQLSKIIKLKENEEQKIKRAANLFPMSITPYYASLIDPNDPNCPIRRQAVPDPKEMIIYEHDMPDPLHEEKDSPVQGLTHRYPDRVLLLATNECSMYCRHCTRKRKVGDNNKSITFKQIKKGIEYIKKTPQIRDVLISGGDPFLLSTESLETLIKEIRNIPHVEIIRLGTRTPVVLPQRITPHLVKTLKKYQPLYINTHFNHPKEFTPQSEEALKRLADAGIPLGNQSVLLRGVNDCPEVMKKLVHLLLKNRVRPYYIYQCDLSKGIEHFRTPISTGIEILERLIGHTSGMAVPRYIIDAPGGGGKIPVQPNYLISSAPDKVILRNYEGVITVYNEPKIYEPKNNCPANCHLCENNKRKRITQNTEPIGIEKLLDNKTSTISLIPKGNERQKRFCN